MRGKNAQGGLHLEEAVALLPTPSAEFTDVPDTETFLARREREKAKGRNGNGFGLTLPMAITLLPRPHGFGKDGQKRRPGPTGNELGRAITKLLPTPTSMDERGSRGHRLDGTPYSENSGVTLTDAALSTGEITPPPSTGGDGSSDAPRLNPSFVEWMMGLPDGWTDTGSPLSATEFSSRPDGSADDGSWSTPP